MIRKAVSLLLALIVCVSFVPIGGKVRSEARSNWADTGSVFGPGEVTADAAVVYDTSVTPAVYRMWYTQETGSYATLGTQINNVRALPGASALLTDLAALNFTNVASADSAGVKAVLHYLATSDIEAITTSVKPTIGYATSPDGSTWTSHSITWPATATWDKNGDSSPAVVQIDATHYEMWYAGRSINSTAIQTLLHDLDLLTAPQLHDVMTYLAAKNISGLTSYVAGISVPGYASGLAYLTRLFTDVTGIVTTTTSAIGRAASTDGGTTWTKDAGGSPAITGTGSAWDEYGVDSPAVIRNSASSYEIWYTGYSVNYAAAIGLLSATSVADIDNVIAGATTIAIGHGTSTNGISWTKDATPVLTHGSASDWDKSGVAAPSVIRTGSTYQLWYTGVNLSLNSYSAILDPGATLQGSVIAGIGTGIGYASSSDGAHWSKDGAPVVTRGGAAAWNGLGVGAPAVVHVGTQNKMYYTGTGGALGTLLSGIAAGTPIDTSLANSHVKASIGLATISTAVIQSIAVTPANPSIAAGAHQSFTATATYSDGTHPDVTSAVTWSSSNTAVASINGSGEARGNTVGGPVTISAVLSGITGSTGLTVTHAALDTITITPANPAVMSGNTLQFHALGTYHDGSIADITTSVVWSTSAGAVAAIGPGTGLATGGGSSGVATITATLAPAAPATTNLAVIAALPSSIVVTPDPASSIAAGTTQQFTATGYFGGAGPAVNMPNFVAPVDLTNSVTWASSAPSVVKIFNGGLATGLTAGSSSNITASLGGVTSTPVSLGVTAAVLDSLTVTPNSPSVTFVSGAAPTLQFVATAIFTDGSKQNVTAAWTSSAAPVATVGAGTGLATTAGAGSTTISASYTTGGITKGGSATFNVLSDTVAPALTLTYPLEGASLGGTSATVTGKVDDIHATIAVIINGTSVGAPVLDGSGNFSQTVTLATGSNNVEVRATDGGHNTGSSGIQTVVVNTSKPTVRITSPVDQSLTGTRAVTVTGTVSDAAITAVSLVVNGTAQSLTATGGNFTGTATLTEGDNMISASAYAAGHSGDNNYRGSSGVITVTSDATAPVVTLTSPAPGSTVATSGVTVSGAVNDPGVTSVNITLNPGAVTVTVPVQGGVFSRDVTIATGANTVVATATDKAGNVGASSTETVTLDTAKPVVNISTPANNLFTNVAAQTISGTVDNPAAASVTLYVNGAASTVAVAGGSFNTTATLNSGANTIEVRATVGPNTGSSGVVAVAVDNTAPVLTIGMTPPTDSMTVTVTSDSALSAPPTVTMGADSVTMSPVDVNQWAGTYGSSLAPITAGTYTVTATGTDKAGNSTTRTADCTKTVVSTNGVGATTVTSGATTLGIQTIGAVSGASLTVNQSNDNASGNVGHPTDAALPAGAFLEINAAPQLRDNLRQIDVRVKYDPALLPAGTDETTLKLYLWDVTSGVWTVVPGSTVNTTTKEIIATLTHLSTYGGFGTAVVIPPAPTPTPTPVVPVVPAFAFVTTALPDGTVNVPYSQNIAVTGGASPYTWSITAGSLPGWVAFGPLTGSIAGTPNSAGTATFTVTVSDNDGSVISENLSIKINPATPPPTTTAPPATTAPPTVPPTTPPPTTTPVTPKPAPAPVLADLANKVDNQGLVNTPVTVASSDNKAKVVIPAGTAARTSGGQTLQQISISPQASPQSAPAGARIVASTYGYGPNGATFSPAVALTVAYDKASVTDPNNLAIAYWDTSSGKWVPLEGCVVDQTAGTVTGYTGHFTDYTVIAYTKLTVFTGSDLKLSSGSVAPGDKVTITVVVANSGSQADVHEVSFKVDNAVVATQKVALNAGASQLLTFTTSTDAKGSHTVGIAGLSATFTVNAGGGINLSVIIIGALVVLALALAAVFIMRRRSSDV